MRTGGKGDETLRQRERERGRRCIGRRERRERERRTEEEGVDPPQFSLNEKKGGRGREGEGGGRGKVEEGRNGRSVGEGKGK